MHLGCWNYRYTFISTIDFKKLLGVSGLFICIVKKKLPWNLTWLASDLYRHTCTHSAYVCEFMTCFIPYLKSINVQGKPLQKTVIRFAPGLEAMGREECIKQLHLMMKIGYILSSWYCKENVWKGRINTVL